MMNKCEYKNLMAFHPGSYIQDIMEDMEINKTEMAKRLNISNSALTKILNGEMALSENIAKKLSLMLGTSIELWINLQASYEAKLAEIKMQKELDKEIKFLKMIEYKYFIDNFSLLKTSDAKEKIKNLCQFFKVSSLATLAKPDFFAACKSAIKKVEEKNVINTNAWIQTAWNLAQDIDCKPFDEKKLIDYLPEIKSMTVKEPEEFIPRLREIFNSCGIAFVLLPNLKNSGINGAVKWINRNKVLLAMNDRSKSADFFWFSLLHEIRHVLQKRLKTIFINLNDNDIASMDEYEIDADRFSSDFWIDPIEFSEFKHSQITKNNIIKFAEHIGIDSGIVVGRLQHEKVISYDRYNDLKRKYDIENILK